jgi:RNA polymerase sigma-70 factor (ECF subfamily)
MPDPKPDTDHLLQRTAAGDNSAAEELLARYRPRLRRMVVVHLDQRISARVDPSDVVQEALAEAFQRLPKYVEQPVISFYPWLRQIAWQRLVKLHRHHITAARRTVDREADAHWSPPDASVAELASRLVASGTDPGQKLIKQEMQDRVRTALDELPPGDRQLLVMRYLEHMSQKEISETLNTTVAAVKMRHARALQRLESHLSDLT